MNLKECLQSQLEAARRYSERLLQGFHTPQEWTHQVHPSANHALWFAGHMGVLDNFFISLIAPDKARGVQGYAEKFGPGSRPSGEAADYPPVEEVLAYMRERRKALSDLLDGMSDEDLNRRTPEGTPEFLREWSDVFRTASWHEGLHSGQVSVAHRALGNKPVTG